LGYREVETDRFDWVLCNVPARIGAPALEYLMTQGARHLNPSGELRVVVIRDLVPTLQTLAARNQWPLVDGPVGARHAIFGLAANPSSIDETTVDHESFYTRDQIEQQGLTFDRPYDISEDPTHLKEGLPLLLELLPRQSNGNVWVWRGGYGVAAVTLALRGAKVHVADPDLLLTTFTQRNARRHGAKLIVEARSTLKGEVSATRYALFVGEISTTQEVSEAVEDVRASVALLAPSGQSLWLGQTRTARPIVERAAHGAPINVVTLATRGPFSVWRLTKSASSSSSERGSG
jgi:hypothetical protein